MRLRFFPWIAAAALSCLLGCDALSARQLAKQAAAVYESGDYLRAAQLYERAKELAPSAATIELNLGFCYLQLLRAANKEDAKAYSEKAIGALTRYRTLVPDDPRGRDYIVQILLDGLRYDDAQAFLKSELEGSKPSLDAISVLQQIASKLGDLRESKRWCIRRQEVAPKDAAGYQCLGSVLWSHLHRHPELVSADRLQIADEALVALKKAAELAPERPDPLTFLNLVHRERALGHPCGVGWDAGVLDAKSRHETTSGTADVDADVEACERAKSEDLARAAEYQAMAKARLSVTQRDAGNFVKGP